MDAAPAVGRQPSRGSAPEVGSISPRELLTLTELDDQLRVSLYLPVPRGSPRAKRRIQWKNLVGAAARQLGADGMHDIEVDRTLQAAGPAFDHSGNGGGQDGGWVYFANPRWSRAMRVRIGVPHGAFIGDRCYIAPLLPLLSHQDRYFLLGLSRDDLQLFAGTRIGLAAVPLEGLPLGPLASMPRGRRPAGAFVAERGDSGFRGLLHGVGATEVDQQRNILEHFRRVDAAVGDLLQNEGPPLILGGVAYLHALYREVNSYPYLLDQGINGSLRDHAPAQLHALAWPIAEAAPHANRRQAIGRFRLLHGTGRTITEARAAAAAADEGRVEVLIVSVDTAGDAATSGVAVKRLSGPSLCVEQAITGTLRNGGAVHAVRPGRMPVPTALAAILRY